MLILTKEVLHNKQCSHNILVKMNKRVTKLYRLNIEVLNAIMHHKYFNFILIHHFLIKTFCKFQKETLSERNLRSLFSLTKSLKIKKSHEFGLCLTYLTFEHLKLLLHIYFLIAPSPNMSVFWCRVAFSFLVFTFNYYKASYRDKHLKANNWWALIGYKFQEDEMRGSWK